jgi:hypothetical protein
MNIPVADMSNVGLRPNLSIVKGATAELIRSVKPVRKFCQIE